MGQVRDVMTGKPTTCEPTATLVDDALRAREVLLSHRFKVLGVAGTQEIWDRAASRRPAAGLAGLAPCGY